MKIWLKRILYRLYVGYKPINSRTVRYAFPLLFFSIAALGAATIISTDASYLTLKSSVSTVQEGQQFSVDVRIYAHEPVNAVDIAIAYPKSQVEITGIDAGQSVITLWTKDPYIQNNTAYFQGGTYRKGFQGDHFIARIDGVAKKSGIAKITAENVKLLAGDGQGTEISVSDSDGKQQVQVSIANKNGEIVGDIRIIKIITDIDGDGQVTLKDVSVFMAAWREQAIIYDFNGDGKMTFRDFGIILSDSFFKK